MTINCGGEPARKAAKASAAPKKMARVFTRLAAVLTLSLGLIAGLVQGYLGLSQQKAAVEASARDLIDSMTFTAAAAVFDFHRHGVRQVIEGLLDQQAVIDVVIWRGDVVFLGGEQTPQQTLPNLGAVTSSDVVQLTQPLYSPFDETHSDVIGRIDVRVDRSILAPEVVDRMLVYFVADVLKNVVLGAVLVLFVFRGLAGHIVRLARVVEAWSPASGPIRQPAPPRYLKDTELDALGSKIAQLSVSASNAVRSLELSNEQIALANSELRGQSDNLSSALAERNERLRVLNQKLIAIANKDTLTGLYNRRYFDEAAACIWTECCGAGDAIALMIIDVDHFKAYNDFYGHQQGDACLRRVATALSEHFAQIGALLARYGGEEFIVLVPGAPAEDLDALGLGAVECVRALRIDHARSLNATTVSVSVGVANRACTGSGQLEDAIGAADRALYEAKAAGRGRYCVASDDLLKALKREEEATQRILEAIRTHAFEPFYQPQIDARTGRIVGLEVLARWRCEDGSVLSPGAFLQKAEELGLDGGIDAIIQERALADLRLWTEAGFEPERFSMNMSETRLISGEIHRLVEKFPDIKRGTLAFEILESTFIERQSGAFEMRIDQLREMGVAIEIDDFGTGHASLTSLALIAPERIKIARELVAPLGSDPRAEKVIDAVLEMARAFEIDVIAEGVETLEQSNLLIDLGCPAQQGFYHGRPAPAEAVRALLQAQSAA